MTIDEFMKIFTEQYKKKNIVVFTGAGMSTASGIKDFRGANGLYKENINAELILSRDYFEMYPKEFYDFYKNYLVINDDIKPNLAHEMIKKLEDDGYVNAVITQNIDCLDIKAGCKNVIEIHGNASIFSCPKCHKAFSSDFILKQKDEPRCPQCGEVIKPGIVLYQEPLDLYKQMQAMEYIKNATTLLVIGSTLKVNPAAGMVHDFLVDTRFNKNKKLFIINKGPTDYDGFKDIIRYDGDVIDFARRLKTYHNK